MAIVRSKQSTNNLLTLSDQKPTSVRVLDIILDISHPKAKDLGGYDAIGTIFYTKIEDNTPLENPETSNTAKPLFSYIKQYPLINEIVLIMNANDKGIYTNGSLSSYYLPNLNVWNHPHHNALPSLKGLKSTKSARDYKSTENGIVRQQEEGSPDIELGKYFKEKTNIKPLLPYEGDTIIEGRFGNSIRFGSTNNSDKIPLDNKNDWSNIGENSDPITLIRNGQSSELDEKGWTHTIENINDDHSLIVMTSNQQISNLDIKSLNFSSYQAKEDV